MNSSFAYLPPDKRKKILLITDDIRVHSGVANVGKEIVLHTSQHFNWVCIGGSIKHPDNGKRFDLSQSTNEVTKLTDASTILYPTDGYGTPELIRYLMAVEKPDAILLITDPRYFTWLFQMENEIRKTTPIAYLNIWDDYPAPMYNKAYYEACDLLMGISKQTVNINKLVLGSKTEGRIFKYVPHGLNHELYYPLDPQDKELKEFKSKVFGNKEIDFVLFFNSRNIRRKQIPDTLLAYRYFLDKLPKEKAAKCAFILHTEVVSEHGTDLNAVKELLLNESHHNVFFSTSKLDNKSLNLLYNLADAQILLTSNEGWGLSITEAILAGTPIVAATTGGLTRQVIDYRDGSHNGVAVPIALRTLVGSQGVPYIYEDYASNEDIADGIRKIYDLNDEERLALKTKVHQYASEEFSHQKTVNLWHQSMLDAIREFKSYKSWEKFTF